MNTKIMGIAVLGLMLSGTALADNHGHGRGEMQRGGNPLELTEAQREQMQTIRTNYGEQMRALRQQMHAEMQAVLTPEQQAKAAEMREARQARMQERRERMQERREHMREGRHHRRQRDGS